MDVSKLGLLEMRSKEHRAGAGHCGPAWELSPLCPDLDGSAGAAGSGHGPMGVVQGWDRRKGGGPGRLRHGPLSAVSLQEPRPREGHGAKGAKARPRAHIGSASRPPFGCGAF